MKRIAFVIAAAAAAIFAQPAQAAAETREDRPTRIVRIADLDLSNPADQEKMVARVERAARRICANEMPLLQRRRCASETVEYTLSIVAPSVRRAYAAATDRRASFALASN